MSIFSDFKKTSQKLLFGKKSRSSTDPNEWWDTANSRSVSDTLSLGGKKYKITHKDPNRITLHPTRLDEANMTEDVDIFRF
jgi:hypothetical protein